MKTHYSLRCLTLAFIGLLATSAHAESSVWKISKGKNYFYLAGTVHLLTAQDYPLPEAYNTAYNDAAKIILETDLSTTQTTEFKSRLIEVMTYSDERTLASELSPQTYLKLQDFMAARQIPIANFAKLKPWSVALMLTMLEYQRLGMMPHFGVDAYFNTLARTDRKPVSGLETAEAQIHFLRSMEAIDPDKNVQYTLRDLHRLPEYVQTMKKSWRSGDIDAYSDNAFLEEMKKDFPHIYQTIVVSRNRSWMKQLPLLLHDNDKELVLVGLLHLVGKEGLLYQLDRQGFKVEQL